MGKKESITMSTAVDNARRAIINALYRLKSFYMDTKTDLDYRKNFRRAVKIWEQNYPWNMRILKMSFIYPFQNKIIQIIGNLTMLSCLLLLLVSTILKLINEIENDIKLSTLVEIIFQIVIFTMMIFGYGFMMGSKKDLYLGAVLMVRMFSSCDDVQEMKVTYSKQGYFLSNLQAGSILLLIISFGIAPVAVPSFLTWALPGNRTFEKTLPFHMEFFTDENEYFYQIFAAQLVSIFIYALLGVSMNYCQCAAVVFIMAEIRCFQYNFKRMKEAYKCKMAMNEENANKWLCEQLKDLVRWHQMCIEYYNLIKKKSSPLMFVLLTGCSSVVVLTGTSMVILVETDLSAATKVLFGFFTTLSAIIFICIPSQYLKIVSDDFYITCCGMNGEIYSPKVRKMLLFIMMRSIKPFAFTAGPTIELNLETCCTIIKTSLSYVATFRSVYTSV